MARDFNVGDTVVIKPLKEWNQNSGRYHSTAPNFVGKEFVISEIVRENSNKELTVYRSDSHFEDLDEDNYWYIKGFMLKKKLENDHLLLRMKQNLIAFLNKKSTV